jgi:hypothetical protein
MIFSRTRGEFMHFKTKIGDYVGGGSKQVPARDTTAMAIKKRLGSTGPKPAVSLKKLAAGPRVGK